ncbi:MAG: DUF481 domain-containing protein [Gammaproteobacteria bacterium]|nr:DUF481 domain-containing protein [Gammaproteobacteria bacterium]
MKKLKKLTVAVGLGMGSIVTGVAIAADENGLIDGNEMAPTVDLTEFNAEDTGWKGQVELGVLLTGGNTENRSINARAGINREVEKWRTSAEIAALNTADKVNTTAEKYGLLGKVDYKLDQKSYLFGVLTYEDDRFSGYEYQATESVGYGYRVIDNRTVVLDFEVGPGARQSKFDIAGSKSENEAILRLGGRLLWKISEKTLFSQSLVSDIGKDLTVTKSISALQAQVAGNLAMKTSLTLNNNSVIPANVTDKTNSELAVTLVYGF